jgi:hypothetical protein
LRARRRASAKIAVRAAIGTVLGLAVAIASVKALIAV